MPFYESIVIARQDVSATQVETLTDEFTGHLTEAGGTIGRREYWGLKSLSYRIKKNRKGHYVLLNYEAPSDAVQEMERNMRLSEDILRYLTIRTDDVPTEPSVIMKRRDERDSRGDRDRGPRRDSRPAAVEAKAETKVEEKAETKVEEKVETKVEAKAETKVEAKTETKAEEKVEEKVEAKVETAAENGDEK